MGINIWLGVQILKLINFLNTLAVHRNQMITTLLQTLPDYTTAFIRIIAGIIIFPYGMQKIFGWFDGPGLKVALAQLEERKIPVLVSWLIIAGQSLGSIALITGFLGRFAAGGLFIIFTAAMITHMPDGWMMNWFNKKKGEGIEYFVMLLAMLLIVVINGSGAFSIDLLLLPKLQ